MKHILLVRSGPYQVDPSSYNLQELGLAAAFSKYGVKCDVVYYNKSKNYDEIFIKNGVEIKVLWRKGIRLLRSGIYPSLLEKSFLKNYDAVICSEYSQIMSILFSKKIKTYIYNGPYYNLFKVPFIEPVYDKLFCKMINSKINRVFCKTKKAEQFLNKKGIYNTVVTGVGLDIEKYNKEKEPRLDTISILEAMKDHKNLLYIGSIIKRKNIELLIRTFNQFANQREYSKVQLIIIGTGSVKYKSYCQSLIDDSLKGRVLWFDHIDNAQAKFVYEAADIFLLPSVKEIFGMVLLEAMYFGLPVVSSNSAGAETLIKNGNNGYIVSKFNEQYWSTTIKKILDNTVLAKKVGDTAHNTIVKHFMWDNIAKRMAKFIR